MPLRLPKANTWFQAQTDANLATYAQAIHDGLVASVVAFPTPPISVIALQSAINSYITALSLATGPGAGKKATSNKNKTKLVLQTDLRINARYVNQIVVGQVAAGQSYDAAQTSILGTGYQLSKDPAPAGPLFVNVLIKDGSYNRGQYYILIGRVVGAKGYMVKISDQTTSEVIRTDVFSGTRMTITDLVPSHMYTFSIAAIGANTTRNFSLILTDRVVI